MIKQNNQPVYMTTVMEKRYSGPRHTTRGFFGGVWHGLGLKDSSVASASGWVREASELPWIEASSAPLSSKPRAWRHAARLASVGRFGGGYSGCTL